MGCILHGFRCLGMALSAVRSGRVRRAVARAVRGREVPGGTEEGGRPSRARSNVRAIHVWSKN